MSEAVEKKQSAFDKFENLLNTYLGPVAEKMDKQRHLSAVKKAMIAMTPLLLIGSFCLIPAAIPNMIGETNPISVWILNNTQYFDLAYNVSMGLMSVFVSVVTAYHLAKSYELDAPGSMSMALVAFLLLGMEMDEAGGIALRGMGSKGLFVAMVASLLAVEVYRWCKKRHFTIKMPDTVPDFISSSFEIIPVTAIVIGLFLGIRVLCQGVFGIMPNEIFSIILAPLVGSMDSPLAVTFYHILRCFIFFFGIHPSVLSPIVQPISTQFLAENIAAVQAGGVATHVFTPGPMSAFGGFTGLGVTMGVVIWFMFSKSKVQREIGPHRFHPVAVRRKRADSVRCSDCSESDFLYPVRYLRRHPVLHPVLVHELGLGTLLYLHASLRRCVPGRLPDQHVLDLDCGQRGSAGPRTDRVLPLLQGCREACIG